MPQTLMVRRFLDCPGRRGRLRKALRPPLGRWTIAQREGQFDVHQHPYRCPIGQRPRLKAPLLQRVHRRLIEAELRVERLDDGDAGDRPVAFDDALQTHAALDRLRIASAVYDGLISRCTRGGEIRSRPMA